MDYNPFTLEGKTILITGSSSGIGRATAIECSRLGAKIIISGRNVEKLNETMALLDGNGHLLFPADLTIQSEIDDLINNLPSLDGIVNNAGMMHTVPFAFIKPEVLNTIFTVNFFAPIYLCQQLVKKKKFRKDASIVFVSAIDGPITAHIGNSMYAASKGAVTAMAKNMAVDLASKRIRVNCVLPGMTETSLIYSDNITVEQLNTDMKLYPLKRYGQPAEIAKAIIYFLSDASSWTTGANLVVDGGYSLL
ncbi:MAG: SDR family oxidoreductase [Bacteroidetes bacterium]|nr:SDR family oxidoreductase [Bacteroidota bacterium]